MLCDSDPEYERVRALVSRTSPEIEKKWFTTRILISMFSVTVCLLVSGSALYMYTARWPDIVWGSMFLALLFFLINMGIGALINVRVKALILAEHEVIYGMQDPASANLLDSDEEFDAPQNDAASRKYSEASSFGESPQIYSNTVVLGKDESVSRSAAIKIEKSPIYGAEDQDNSYDPKHGTQKKTGI